MGDVDAVVAERLKRLAEYVDELHEYRGKASSFQVYQEDTMLRRAVERTLQIAVESCLDIGRRLIALEGFRFPEDNKDVFQVLAEEGVVPRELLPALLDMARFRNIVVHNYAKLDDARVYGILKKRLGDFDAYARAIVEYLTEKAGEETSNAENDE